MFTFLKPPPIQLGPPPWDEDLLVRASFVNHESVNKALDAHPGRELQNSLESLTSVLRLFNKTAESIHDCIAKFDFDSREGNLLGRSRKHDLEALEEQLQEALYIFAAASMTLVDQSRALSGKIQIPNYAERIANVFSNSPRHRFVQELRVDMVHITLHEPNWQITQSEEKGRSSCFLLQVNQLRRLDSYHKLAKRFVSENSKGIDVGSLIRTYSVEVNNFQNWLRDSVSTVAAEALTDYQRSRRIVHAVSSRSTWKLILSQIVIQGKLDPYAYLDRYLTPMELEKIRAMPHRSIEQVDRIIELIDEYGACDAEVRTLAYKAFGIEKL